MPAHISMTERQRAALLALPDTETMVVRHHGPDAEDMSAIGIARTPATRLSYALQLCCLRYPGRHLRAGELLPAIMLDHIADQVGVDARVVADFARRTPTRYDQLAAIKARFGFTDLSQPVRTSMMAWLATEAMPIIDGHILLDLLLDDLRTRRIVIPGISVVERMAAEAMLRAETDLVTAVDDALDAEMRQRLDTLVDDKVHDRQSRFSWLREPDTRVAPASLTEILEKVALIRWTGISRVLIDPRYEPRLTQFAREGVRYTAQAFQQMRPARRRVILLATLREQEATLTDAAIAMFGALMGRAQGHDFNKRLHDFADESERLLMMLLLLLLFGGMLAAGLLNGIGWEEVTFAAMMLLIVRPLAGWISLIGVKRPKLELAIISFFGIRGLGSVYYLSYGFNHAAFRSEYSLWGTLGLIIAASILMHGVLVTPALKMLHKKYRALGIVDGTNCRPEMDKPEISA